MNNLLEADHIYYDITIPYEAQKDKTGYGMPIEYNQVKSEAILEHPNEYHMSIERFYLPAWSLPVYIHDPENTGVVMLEYNGDQSPAPLVFNYQAVSPPPAITVPFDKYYYVYDVQNWVNMVNSALAVAFAGLTAPPAGATAPYLVFDAETKLITLMSELAYYEKGLALPIKIFMDERVFKQLPNMSALFNGGIYKWLIVVEDLNGSNIINKAGVDFVATKQQAVGMWAFNPVQSILFTTSSIPVRPTFTDIATSSAGTRNSIPILMDFKLDVNSPAGQREPLIYEPAYQRFSDMVGDTPMKQINVNVYWTNHANHLFPITLKDSEQASIKLLFTKRGIKGGNPLLNPQKY